jgi:hypothetical protein
MGEGRAEFWDTTGFVGLLPSGSRGSYHYLTSAPPLSACGRAAAAGGVGRFVVKAARLTFRPI